MVNYQCGMVSNMDEIYMPRLVDQLLLDQLESSGAVQVIGPKWCGKTTTAEHVSKSVLKMDDPDNGSRYRALANLQPSLLLEGETPRLIDEWQLAPNLWNAVRATVDKRRKFGQFILTGSSVPQKMEKSTHSGLGRIAKVKLRPMSLYESNDSSGLISLANLFKGEAPAASGNGNTLQQIAFLICRGGWPLSIGQSEKVALLQSRNYYNELIDNDIIRSETGEKLDPERAKRVLRSYARNISQSVSIEEIRKDSIFNDDETFSQVSIYNYLSFLKRIFVLEDSQAWNPNLRSKTAIRSAETRYFVDPSIGCSALGICPQDLVNDLNTMGLFFENMAIRDLRAYADVLGGQIYHYRDKSGLECDAVMHLENGTYGLIEIKLGSEAGIKEGIQSLSKFDGIIDTSKMKAPAFKMIVTGTGEYAYREEHGIDIVPLNFLKP